MLSSKDLDFTSCSFGEYGMNWGRKCVRAGERVVFREVFIDGATRHSVGVAISILLRLLDGSHG